MVKVGTTLNRQTDMVLPINMLYLSHRHYSVLFCALAVSLCSV